MRGMFIGDIDPKVGDKVYSIRRQCWLTVLEIDDPQVGIVFAEGNIQGEFMEPMWLSDSQREDA